MHFTTIVERSCVLLMSFITTEQQEAEISHVGDRYVVHGHPRPSMSIPIESP